LIFLRCKQYDHDFSYQHMNFTDYDATRLDKKVLQIMCHVFQVNVRQPSVQSLTNHDLKQKIVDLTRLIESIGLYATGLPSPQDIGYKKKMHAYLKQRFKFLDYTIKYQTKHTTRDGDKMDIGPRCELSKTYLIHYNVPDVFTDINYARQETYKTVLSYHDFTHIDFNTASNVQLKAYAYTALLYEDTGVGFVPWYFTEEKSKQKALQCYYYHPLYHTVFEPDQTTYTCSYRVKSHYKKTTFELCKLNRITYGLQDGVYRPNGCIQSIRPKTNPIPCRIMVRKIKTLDEDRSDLEQHRERFALIVPKKRYSKITI